MDNREGGGTFERWRPSFDLEVCPKNGYWDTQKAQGGEPERLVQEKEEGEGNKPYLIIHFAPVLERGCCLPTLLQHMATHLRD